MPQLSQPPVSTPLVDPNTGYGTQGFKDWLIRLFSRSGGESTDLAPDDARYLLTDSDSRLPNAQAINELDAGFVTQTGGVLSSTGNLKIQSSDLQPTGVDSATYGSSGQSVVISVGSDGRITDAYATTIIGTTPGGTALGDLSGSYPNPTVSQIQGVAVSSTNATAVSNLTGVNSGDQTITLTGDVTGSGTGSFAATIGNNKVTYAKLATSAGNGIVDYATGAGTGTANKLVFSSGYSGTSFPLITCSDTNEILTFGGSLLQYSVGTNVLIWQFGGSFSVATFKIANTTVGTWTFGGIADWTFPTAHPSTTGKYCTSTTGGDMSFQAVSESEISFTDITTNNVSTSKHGYVPKLPNDSSKFLDGTGAFSSPAGSGTVNSGTAGQIAYYATSSTAVSGNANLTISNGEVTAGVATSVIGKYKLCGNTSGTITIQPQAAAGTYNFNLPTTAGSSGQLLVSGGGSSTAMSWTTPTYPTSSATSRKIIVSDGTNFVSSTETWATPSTSGNVLKSDGTNWTSAADSGNLLNVQVLTTTGTYTPTSGTKTAVIHAIGGGGGGAGSGQSGTPGAGGNGGNTTFNTTTVVANGGSGAGANGVPGNGGAAGTGNIIAMTGNPGGSGQLFSSVFNVSGFGGSSAWGGGGSPGGGGAAGNAGQTNSGGGGSGGGENGNSTQTPFSGSGGGSGSYSIHLLSSVSGTYSYAIGAAGSAGSAGTNGFAGGAGGKGVIVIYEYS